MRKRMTTMAASLLMTAFLFAQMPNWGVADTLEHYPVGPGIDYCKVYFQGKKTMVWVTTVDLTNPHNQVEQAQSRNQVPDLSRWTVPQFSTENTWAGHKVCAAFNHDFFVYESGVGIGSNISNGEITYNKWGRSVLAIDAQKRAGVFYPHVDSKIITANGKEMALDHYNGHGLGLSGESILFNRFNSLTLTEAGKYIQLKPMDAWTVNGDNIRCEVLAVSDQPLQSSHTEYVLFLRGAKLNALDGKVAVGDTIEVMQRMYPSVFGTPLEEVVQGFHGYPSIAFEGKLHEGQYNDFENGREYEISSRTMAGHSQDGKKLYIVVNEMSTTSAGVDCVEMANFMLAIGCWNVVNFDSGGSAAIVVNHEMLNYPARGSIRPVVDALLAVSVAPESDTITRYRFHKPAITTSMASLVPLRLLAFNAYDDVVEWDSHGFTFRCEPASLGYVDSLAVFHAATAGGVGKIIAQKNGIEAELALRVEAVSDIFIDPKTVRIDNTRSYPIQMWYRAGTEQLPISPAAFAWHVADATVCAVNNGVLTGLKSGTTQVVATLDAITDTLLVIVEVPESDKVVWDNFSQADMRWELKTSSSAWDAAFVTNQESDTELQLTYSTARQPYLKLELDSLFYGLPDSITLRINTNELPISKLSWTIYAQDQKQTLEFEDIPTNQEVNLTINTAELGGIEQFPLRNSFLNFAINSSQVEQGKQYALTLLDITQHYPTAATGVCAPLVRNQLVVFPNPAVDRITIQGHLASATGTLQLYATNGLLLQESVGTQMNLFGHPAGCYVVRYTTAEGSYTTLLMIK